MYFRTFEAFQIVVIFSLKSLTSCSAEDSHTKTFIVLPKFEDRQSVLGMPISVTFFGNFTRIDFYGNSTTFELQLMHKTGSYFICKNSTDPNSHLLSIRNNNNYNFCGLSPMNIYYLKLNLSILDKENFKWNNNGSATGKVRIYSTHTTYVKTYSSFIETQQRTIENEATSSGGSSIIHYQIALIILGIILAIIAAIAAIVCCSLRQKAKRKQEQLSSSGSWTQQNFDSINSTDLYIRNEVYDRTGAKSSKKFSVSSEYSNPADEEYDEPIYSDGRETIYESIYESAYVSPKDASSK